MTSGPVVFSARGQRRRRPQPAVMGATNPRQADEGTIRKAHAESIEANSVHGSDSDEMPRSRSTSSSRPTKSWVKTACPAKLRKSTNFAAVRKKHERRGGDACLFRENSFRYLPRERRAISHGRRRPGGTKCLEGTSWFPCWTASRLLLVALASGGLASRYSPPSRTLRRGPRCRPRPAHGPARPAAAAAAIAPNLAAAASQGREVRSGVRRQLRRRHLVGARPAARVRTASKSTA